MNRLFKNNIPRVVLVLCLKGNGQSGLKVSFVNKGLGTGLTLSLSPCVHYPTIQCQWIILACWIACSLFSGRRTWRSYDVCQFNTFEWCVRASLLLPSTDNPWIIMEPTGQYVLYLSGSAVTGVDPWGEVKDEMNSCVLGCVDYEQIITQHPCYHILGSLPLPPGTAVAVSFNLHSNFKFSLCEPLEKKVKLCFEIEKSQRWNERV